MRRPEREVLVVAFGATRRWEIRYVETEQKGQIRMSAERRFARIPHSERYNTMVECWRRCVTAIER
ncbi:hypothetical protein BD310DRAFT_862484 [Dichomitus squalens]|uniref:Uncharacterized protein n=1 Tax=Dichomitus squalens TaxID=114155 RepID=A0A4Q9PDA5_9APHY|nr:hypothetical protein BD310DRAFT_862484 [Dichomitus squalens]